MVNYEEKKNQFLNRKKINYFFLSIDYAKGFGGKYGVANDRKDKAAVGFDHVEQLSRHSSQTGNTYIFEYNLEVFKILKLIS